MIVPMLVHPLLGVRGLRRSAITGSKGGVYACVRACVLARVRLRARAWSRVSSHASLERDSKQKRERSSGCGAAAVALDAACEIDSSVRLVQGIRKLCEWEA
eukprot:6056419-Pleurochrysis_carterae.AAC.4